MAQFLRDEGDVSVFLTEGGQEVRVAKEYAQPYALGAEQAPPAPEPTAPDLSLAAQGAPQLPQDIGPDLAPPAPAPTPVPDAPLPTSGEITMAPEDLRPAEQQPIAEPEVTFQPDDLRPPPPDILPQSVPSSPTGIANAINQGDQQKSDAAFRTGEAKAGALEQIAAANEEADAKIAEQERLQEEERKQRQLDERVLTDDYGRLLKRHEHFRLDPTRGMSGDRQTWAWIAAAISGLGRVVSGRDPSSNPGLDTLMKQFDIRVQHQMAEQDALGNTIGMKRQELTDFRGATKDRLAQYDLRMAGELNRAARTAETAGKRAAAVSDREAAKEVAATLRQEATARLGSAAAQEAEMRARARAARAAAMARAQKAAEEQRRFMAKEKVILDPATGRYIPDPAFAKPVDGLEAREQVAKTTKAEADAAAATLAGSTGERERLYGIPGTKTKSGAVPLAGTTDEARDLRNGKASLDTATRLIDEMIALRKRDGWSSDLVKSDEWRQIQVNFNDLKLSRKDIDKLGVLAGPDMDLIEGALGTSDPTEVRDPLAGLEKSRANMVNKYNASLRSVASDAERYEPQRLYAAEAPGKKLEENIRIASQPLTDIAKADPDERAKQAETRVAAWAEVARQAEDVDTLKQAAATLTQQHEAGEIDDDQFVAARAKLAGRALRLRAKERLANPASLTMGAARAFDPTYDPLTEGGQ